MTELDRSSDVQTVRAILADSNLPIFVSRLQHGARSRLTVGTIGGARNRSIAEHVRQQLQRRGLSFAVDVVRHNPAKFAKVRSLEALIEATGKGALVFDRTLVLERTEAIVAFGDALRAEAGAEINELYFQSERRTLFILTAPSVVRDQGARQRLAHAIEAAEEGWRRSHAAGTLQLSVRVGTSVPSGVQVVAVDRRTARAAFLRLLRPQTLTRWTGALIGILGGAVLAVPATAADLATELQKVSEPAVDTPNVTVTTLAGIARDPVLFDHMWAGLGVKGTIPLGERFGAQLDLGVASDSYYGAALHLFARDPVMGLVGVVGSAENQYGVSMNRVGAELEYYLNESVTVGARVGYQGGTAPNGAFGRLDVKFYPDANLALSGGVELQPSFALARGGFEWRPAVDALAGISISGDASVTSTGNYRATFGLHFQIGGSESLRDRDRKSDPGSAIFNQIDVKSAAYGGWAPL